MLVKKIGLEFEFICISEKTGKVVFPHDYEFLTDEFIILGEDRTEPQTNMAVLVGDFYAKWTKVREMAKKSKLFLDELGFASISPEFYADILRRMGGKEISVCKNLYKHDILKMTDAQVHDGKIENYFISTGLHLHFSLFSEQSFKRETFAVFNGDLYKKLGESTEKKVENVLPQSQMYKIIRFYDKKWLGILTKDMPRLKFRYPGYYETKSWGFEYRSLPFNKTTINHLPEILSDGFKLLDQVKFI